jgi:hypothetical protein
MWNLCSGKTWAKPSAFSIAIAMAPASWCLASSKIRASTMLGPILRSRAISRAIAIWSPVTIFTATPIPVAVSMVDRESCRGGSWRGRTPR